MTRQDDPYGLNRFVAAQERVYESVRAELCAGRKTSHWMWFVFPQIAGLGFSPTAQFYAIASLAEAKAYLAHPILGARLRECASLVLKIEGRSLLDIFGQPDNLKFRSSMTLFARAAPEETVFAQNIRKYCGGEEDTATLAQLSAR